MNKILPHNLEAEQSFLGSVLVDKDAIFKVGDTITAADFYNRRHQLIYDAILTLFEKNEQIDILTVSNKLEEKKILEECGGNSYLAELTEMVPTAAHVLDYAKIIKDKKILRGLISVSLKIAEFGYQEDEETDVLLDKAEKEVFDIAQKNLIQKFILVKDLLGESFERIDYLHTHQNKTRGVATGYIDLDNKLSGLQKSDLIILAARPSLGKSALALDIARNVSLEGTTVGFFSLEMSKDQIVDRLISIESGINLWKIRNGRLSEKNNDFKKIKQALDKISKMSIYINDLSSCNVLQIKAMARRLQAQKGLGLLIVDYLQLMESRGQYHNPVQAMSEISRSLKILARELDVPILALSQLNRSVEQRMPQIPRLSDLRESGCLTGDTLIIQADTGERIPIQTLAERKEQTPISVFSLGEDYKLHIKKMTRVFYSGEKEVYEIKTRSGEKIKASANHPFWTTSGWKRLDELKIGTHIATPKKLEISAPKNEMSKEEIILLAHLLGDGCILSNRPYHYTSADIENIKVVAETATKLFDIKPRIVKQKNWWHVYLPSPYHLTHRKYHPITNWYKKLEIRRVRSYEKEIPQKAFSLDNKHLSLFLRHLWATDGHIGYRRCKQCENKRKKLDNKSSEIVTIYYASTSEKMIMAIKHLLLRFGIRVKIRESKKGSYRICYQAHIQGTYHQMIFLKEIGCFGKRGKIIPRLIKKLEKIKKNTNLDVWPKETWQIIINPLREEKGISWRDFSTGIDAAYSGSSLFKSGIGVERMQRIAQCLQSPIVANMSQSNIFWDEIITIKPLGIQKVYDATVPGLHNFIANGIIVENSIEQDADVVMFIHRRDKYDENAQKGLAEIIIAKHRNGPTGKVDLFFEENLASFKSIDKKHEYLDSGDKQEEINEEDLFI